jgi:zinc protease
MVVTTLSKDPMPETMAAQPPLSGMASAASPAAAAAVRTLAQPSALPQLDFKLLFTVGSAHDPAGKEGLAALAASMIAEAGSRAMRIDEIKKALFPMAGGFDAQVDKEMTTFTGGIHRTTGAASWTSRCPCCSSPGCARRTSGA